MTQDDNKRKLYWLINHYLADKISAEDFTSEYDRVYNIELDKDTLSHKEHDAFRNLSPIVGRFSPFEEDLMKYPGAYFTETELRAKVIETKKILAEQFETYEIDQLINS